MTTSPRNEDLSSEAHDLQSPPRRIEGGSAKEEEKPEFEVIDRRKAAHVDLSSEASAKVDLSHEEPAEEPLAEEVLELTPEEEAQVREELLEALYPDDVYTVFRTTVALLANLAWQKMGLVPNPRTQKLEQDLEEARAAIDVVSFIVEQMTPKADEAERRDLANLVANLKINFVQQSQ